MPLKNTQLNFFIALTISILVLLFFVFKPFFGIIFISGVLSVIFYPLYQKFLVWFKNNESLSSILTVIVIVLFVIIPLAFISLSIFKEAVGMYNSVASGSGTQKMIVYFDSMLSRVGQTAFYDYSSNINVENYFRDILVWIIGHFGSFFEAVFNSILGFVLTLISIYYFLRNGGLIRENIIKWSPLPDTYDEEILDTAHSLIDSILRGRFLVCLAQGFFLGLVFFIFGIGNPVLWGFIGGLASLIPIFGTSVIVVPASVYLFVNGNVGASLGLLLCGALAVGPLDQILSAFILKNKIKINPLVILISIIGAVQLFGPLGFIAGPVLVSALLSLIKIYSIIKNGQL